MSKLDPSDQGKFVDIENGLGTQGSATAFGAARFYEYKDKNSANEDINKYYDDISHFKTGEVQEIYISKGNAVKFQVNFDTEIKTDSDYLDDIKINKWDSNANKWVTVTSWKSNNSDWWLGEGQTESTTVIRAMGTADDDGYDKITYTADGTDYQILATDISGNANCQYFKLYLDNKGPVLVNRSDANSKNPTIEPGMGSIGKIESGSNTEYFYTAKNETGKQLTVKFAMSDAGLKNSVQKFYYSFDN